MKASEVSQLTPQVIQQAETAAKHPGQGRKVGEMEMTMHRWAGNVRQLVDATQQANLPWSRTMQNLVTAAKSGEGLEKQVSLIRASMSIRNLPKHVHICLLLDDTSITISFHSI